MNPFSKCNSINLEIIENIVSKSNSEKTSNDPTVMIFIKTADNHRDAITYSHNEVNNFIKTHYIVLNTICDLENIKTEPDGEVNFSNRKISLLLILGNQSSDNADNFVTETISCSKKIQIYLKAIQGDAKAQFNLAQCYQNGDGFEKSLEQAFEWYTQAAKQGNV